MLKKQSLTRHVSKKYKKQREFSRRSGVQISPFSDLETFWSHFGPQIVPRRQNCNKMTPEVTQLRNNLDSKLQKGFMFGFRAAGFGETY